MRRICTFSVSTITLLLGATAFPISAAACPPVTSEAEVEIYMSSKNVAAAEHRSAPQHSTRAETSWAQPRRYTAVEIGAIRVLERMR
jgi:hypothetical protein